MARHGSWRYSYDEPATVTTTPFLCLVLIIIPMLLLSTMFVQLAVVENTMPPRNCWGPVEPNPPDRLQLYIGKDEFVLFLGRSGLASESRRDSSQELIEIPAAGDRGHVGDYDWLELYNTLIELKRSPRFARQGILEIVPARAVPWAVVVKAMDISQYQRAPRHWLDFGTTFDTEMALNASEIVRVEGADSPDDQLGLFPGSLLGLPRP